MKLKIIETSVSLVLLFVAALPTVAVTTSPTPRPPSSTPIYIKVDPVCMASAVEKRDSAMITAVDTYHSAVTAALKTRKHALKSAWGISDPKARKNALTAAWITFNGTFKKADRALKSSRKTVWRQFGAERKACHGYPSDEPGSKGSI